MKVILRVLLLLQHVPLLFGQSTVLPAGRVDQLNDLIDQALVTNPEIHAAIHEMGRAAAVVPQAGSVDDPILFYEREEMPGFQWDKPSMQRIGLMQTFRFPTKLGTVDDVAEINAEHAHHIHLEVVNNVILRVKLAYFDLWSVQQSILLNRETAHLLALFGEAARTRYESGQGAQQEVLKTMVELGKVEVDLTAYRQEEQSTKAMLMSLTGRFHPDTIGSAVLGKMATIGVTLNETEEIAMRNRPLLIHDSLTIMETEAMAGLARDEYLPDLLLGLEYITWSGPQSDAWTVRAGISLPFAPWTLGKAGGRVEEADAEHSRSMASYAASRNMVVAALRDTYLRAQSARGRLSAYEATLLPQARQAFEATLVSYRTGKESFLMLIDSYRMLVDLSEEYVAIRRDFEKSVAELEFNAGVQNLALSEGEGKSK